MFFADGERRPATGRNDRPPNLGGGERDTGFSGDNGPASGAQLGIPRHRRGLHGNLYIADTGNSRVRKASNGVMTTAAGSGTAAEAAELRRQRPGHQRPVELSPRRRRGLRRQSVHRRHGITNRIRKVSNGVITTVAGNGTAGFSGDNGPATSAQLNHPQGVAVDSAGNLYIADTANNRIRKVSNGVITTVAGNGTCRLQRRQRPGHQRPVEQPHGVAVDSAGNLYIADTE